jgi:ABC-type uncharacterized transport system ATPase subunit
MSETADVLLRVEGVFTNIGRYRILHGVDFSLRRGRVTALLGRNGAGKTTTLRTIMGLWKARLGKIVFDGQPITALETPHIARRGIAYVPENGHLRQADRAREHAAGDRPHRLCSRPARSRAAKLSCIEDEVGLAGRLAVRRTEANARDRPRHHRAAPAVADRRADRGAVAGEWISSSRASPAQA